MGWLGWLAGSSPEQELLAAAKKGDTVALERLISVGTECDVHDKHGKTPLLRAAKYGHVEACMILLQANASLFAKTTDQRNALHLAAAAGHEPVLRFLLSSGAVRLVDCQDASGRRPVDVVRQSLPENKRKSMIEALEQAPAKANARESNNTITASATVSLPQAEKSKPAVGSSLPTVPEPAVGSSLPTVPEVPNLTEVAAPAIEERVSLSTTQPQEQELTVDEMKELARAEAALYGQIPTDDEAKKGLVEVKPENYAAVVANQLALLDETASIADKARINSKKCKHLMHRLQELRPVLTLYKQKLELNGPKVVEDIDSTFKRCLIAIYDLFQDAQAVVSGWAACNMGDFSSLLGALTADEFNLDFVCVRYNLQDVLEQLKSVNEVLKLSANFKKDWDVEFEEADKEDRANLVSEAIDIVRDSPETGAVAHKILFEQALSSSDLMVALLQHNIQQTELVDKFTSIVEQHGSALYHQRRAVAGPEVEPAADGEEFKNDADKC